MQLSATKYFSAQPHGEIRWIFHEGEDEWSVRQPPEDWAANDYEAAKCDLGWRSGATQNLPHPELADKFFLASPIQMENAGGGLPWKKSTAERDLYLKFASLRGIPSQILQYANQYGFLKPNNKRLSTQNAVRIHRQWDLDPKGVSAAGGVAVDFFLEPASAWLQTFDAVRHFLHRWEEVAERAPAERIELLCDFHIEFEPKMSFHLDPDLNADGIARSLQDLLWIQWGTSIGSRVIHRRCTQCEAYMAIHPDTARKDKHFCSDACRMRAYRLRKSGKAI